MEFENASENESHGFGNFGYLALEKFWKFFKGVCMTPFTSILNYNFPTILHSSAAIKLKYVIPLYMK